MSVLIAGIHILTRDTNAHWSVNYCWVIHAYGSYEATMFIKNMYARIVAICTIEVSLTVGCNSPKARLVSVMLYQFKPTVRGRHKLVVSVDDQQVEGSPFRIFVSISPYQLGYPVKIWRNIPVPKGVALTSEGKVIVATSAGNIVKLKKGGNYETILEQNTLRGLHKIEIDEENNIFCGSENNNIILRCDPDGENVRLQEIKHKNWPRGLAIIGKEVLITQGGNRGTIHVYNGNLKYIRSNKHQLQFHSLHILWFHHCEEILRNW